MSPVLSSTGAVRLEEVGRGALLVVQIPAKSIVFDQKAGQRDGQGHRVRPREHEREDELGPGEDEGERSGGDDPRRRERPRHLCERLQA